MSADWWLDFFSGERSDSTLTLSPQAEVTFILQLCQPANQATVYDQCCGKGHLAHALSESGLSVIGVDASRDYIDFARRRFESPGCRFIQADAREFVLEGGADLVINWKTSFAYCEEDHENMRMLAALSSSLKVGGEFVILTINPDYLYAHFQQWLVRYIDYQDSSIIAIRESYLEERMLKSNWLFVYPDGTRETSFGQTRLYRLADFASLLSRHNLMIKNAFGDLNFEPFHSLSPHLIIHGIKV